MSASAYIGRIMCAGAGVICPQEKFKEQVLDLGNRDYLGTYLGNRFFNKEVLEPQFWAEP